jgi:hypothetical protein
MDRRAFTESARADSATAIVGTFDNYTAFFSNGELGVNNTLSKALGIEYAIPGRVEISRPSASASKLDFRNGAEDESLVKTYETGKGLSIGRDGKFVISLGAVCGGHDSPGFGCGNSSVTLFINDKGDLAAISSGSAAGVIGIFPIALYTRHLAIFPRLE